MVKIKKNKQTKQTIIISINRSPDIRQNARKRYLGNINWWRRNIHSQVGPQVNDTRTLLQGTRILLRCCYWKPSLLFGQNLINIGSINNQSLFWILLKISLTVIKCIILEHFHSDWTSSSPLEKPSSACCLVSEVSWFPCHCETDW